MPDDVNQYPVQLGEDASLSMRSLAYNLRYFVTVLAQDTLLSADVYPENRLVKRLMGQPVYVSWRERFFTQLRDGVRIFTFYFGKV